MIEEVIKHGVKATTAANMPHCAGAEYMAELPGGLLPCYSPSESCAAWYPMDDKNTGAGTRLSPDSRSVRAVAVGVAPNERRRRFKNDKQNEQA